MTAFHTQTRSAAADATIGEKEGGDGRRDSGLITHNWWRGIKLTFRRDENCM